jgi:hypothetical protein
MQLSVVSESHLRLSADHKALVQNLRITNWKRIDWVKKQIRTISQRLA